MTYLLNSQEYNKVIILVRKSLNINHPKLQEEVIDFDKLQEYQEYVKVDDVFCCIGTTIKKAKTKERFKRVDVEYPIIMGELALEMKVKKFCIVSSMGADPKSKVFYSRMKGIMEEKLKELNLQSLYIFRPSLLLGDRKDFRLGESIGAVLSKGLAFTFIGPLKKYRPITAKKVAFAMFRVAQSQGQGNHIYLSDQIEAIR